MCFLSITIIIITIIIIIIISNTIPPIAPAITGTAPELVAVLVVIDGGMVDGDEVDVFIVDDNGVVPVNETSIEECNELVLVIDGASVTAAIMCINMYIHDTSTY